jgi:hypothetical protein
VLLFVLKLPNFDQKFLGEKVLILPRLRFGQFFLQNWALFSPNIWSHCSDVAAAAATAMARL